MTDSTVGGLDVAFSNDYMAFVLVRLGSDGVIRLVHLDTWRKFDWQAWKSDMAAKQKRFDIRKTYVDRTNNQSVVFELADIGMPVEGLPFSNYSKHEMIRNTTKLIVTEKFAMPKPELIESPKQKRLLLELKTQIAEQEYAHQTSKPRLTHPSGSHDDLLWALCLALYGLAVYTPSIPLVWSGDYDDYQNSGPNADSVIRNILDMIPPGVAVKDIKIKMPWEL